MENDKNVAYDTHVTVIDKVTPEPTKLRVAAYVRVDNGSQDKTDLLGTQVDHYTKFITAYEGWELVDVYSDLGPAGTDAEHRESFHRMIQDCKDGKIDRIFVKSMSRFSRNTQECINYILMLLRLGVTVFFEKEHMDTGTNTFLRLMTAASLSCGENPGTLAEHELT